MRGLFTFFSVLGLLALIGSGLYFGVGYGLEYVGTKLEDSIEAELPGETVEVSFEKFYFAKNFSQLALQVLVDSSVTPDETRYVTVSLTLEVNEVASLTTDDYFDLSTVFARNPQEIKNEAMAYGSVSAAAWIGFWVLKVFLPKRKK